MTSKESPIATTASLAMLVKKVFESAPKSFKPDPNSKPDTQRDQRQMHIVWQDTLAPPKGLGPYYERLIWLAGAVEKLSDQIKACPHLSDESKKIYSDVVRGLHQCVSPKYLHRQITEMAPLFSADKLNNLVLMSDILKHTYPQTILTNDGVEKIKEILLSLEKMISDSQIASELKETLEYHFQQMSFAINNTDLYGINPVFDSTGRAILQIKREEEKYQTESNAGLFQKLKDGLISIYKKAEQADKVAQTIEKHHERISSGIDAFMQLIDKAN